MRSTTSYLAFAFAAVIPACSSGNGGPLGDGGQGRDVVVGGARDGNAGGRDVVPIVTDSSTPPGDDCSDAARLVYVLSDANELYSFQPAERRFTRIGRLSCRTNLLPNSMAVDRSATAWVNYVESDALLGDDTAGMIYRVSTTDATCAAAAPIPLQAGWYRLGMGFVSDAAGSDRETLFVTGTPGLGQPTSPGLGLLDTASMRVRPVGVFDGPLRGQSAELTGTGAAKLYGFFTTTPVQVAEIDKTSGAITAATPLAQVETPSAWAFSFWGGDFYLYTAPDRTTSPGRTSNVTRYRPSTGAVDPTYMMNIGFRIVGAGVSTCAPTEPPG